MPKTIIDWEQSHGQTRIAELEKALAIASAQDREIILDMPTEDNTLRFGVIGDTHWSSRYEAGAQCAAFYKYAHASGVQVMLHSGDVLSGHRVYPGHEYDLHKIGWAQQRAWFSEVAPRIEGLDTHFITGNHDASFKKSAGVDVGVELAKDRPDWKFLGEDSASITMVTRGGRTYKVQLLHPDGGTAYAISYKAQKAIESIEGGRKPNMICIGHFHKADMMPTYRNVVCIQTGCFEWQTPFMVRRGIAAHVGGWIVEITLHPEDALANSVKTEFVAFYNTQS